MPAYIMLKVDTRREPAKLSIMHGVPAIYFGDNKDAYLLLEGATVEATQVIIAMMNGVAFRLDQEDLFRGSNDRH